MINIYIILHVVIARFGYLKMCSQIILTEHRKPVQVIRVDNAYNHIQVRPDDNK